MFPHFNPHLPFSPPNANNNPPSAPQQVMWNPGGNFVPNPIINPQTSFPFTTNNNPNQFFPIQLQQQPMPHIFAQNQNQLQNLNQILQLQNMLQNLNNLNLPQNLAFFANNQSANVSFPQSVGFFPNTHPGCVDSGSIVQKSANLNAFNGNPINGSQPLQGSLSLVQGFDQKHFQQPLKLQGNQRNVMGTHMIKNNGKSPQNNNLKRNAIYEAPQKGFLNSKFHKRKNAKGNFSGNMQSRRGNNTGGQQTSNLNSAVQAQTEKKRSFSLNYTEKEIREWREERKKNYPSKLNIEKKLLEKLTKPDVNDQTDKLRRQQLKEILTKQAELGCEVAEIPSHYLSDSEQQFNGGKESGRALSKHRKFQNKFNNKRGRLNQNGRFSSRKGFENDDSSGAQSKSCYMAKKQRAEKDHSATHHVASEKDPTLLQKLLSADIRRDRHHILQVFRFMVMNSFFKDWPEKPLKLPVVMVKDETLNEDEFIEVNAADGKKEKTGGLLGEIEEALASDCNDDDDNNNNAKN